MNIDHTIVNHFRFFALCNSNMADENTVLITADVIILLCACSNRFEVLHNLSENRL